MKYVKMLGLTAVAVAALMAFVGSSVASATVLCNVEGEKKGTETTGTTCPEGHAYGVGTEIHAVLEGTDAKLTTSFLTIECPASTVSGKIENAGSATETVKGKVETLTFENCTNCADVTVIKKGELEVHWINNEDKGSHNGTLTSNGAEVTVSCSTVFGTVHCIYVTENTDLGTLTGGVGVEKEATLDVESANIPRLSTNALCAEKANWDAKYLVTSPKPLYVAGHT